MCGIGRCVGCVDALDNEVKNTENTDKVSCVTLTFISDTI